MRLYLTFFLLTPFLQSNGQFVPINKIRLDDAISVALMINAGQKSESYKKALVAEVEKTYFQLVYEKNKSDILKEQALLMENMEKVADLRYEAGDIDLLEKNTMIGRFADINTALSRMEDDLSITRNNLKILLLTEDDLMPFDTVLSMYALNKNEEPLNELDSAGQFVHEKKRENLEYELNNSFKKLQYFRQVALGQASQLLEINRARFENEDIDYSEYTLRADEAYHIQLGYLETLNTYNQTAIQLEFYAY